MFFLVFSNKTTINQDFIERKYRKLLFTANVQMYSGSEGCAGFTYIKFISSMTSNYINKIFGST